MSAYEQKLFRILKIAWDTSRAGRGVSLRQAQREADYGANRRHFRVADLIPLLAAHPEVAQEWLWYSEDKRTGGGWYLLMERTIGVVGRAESVKQFDTIEEAVAEYVVRELDFWEANSE